MFEETVGVVRQRLITDSCVEAAAEVATERQPTVGRVEVPVAVAKERRGAGGRVVVAGEINVERLEAKCGVKFTTCVSWQSPHAETGVIIGRGERCKMGG